MPYQITLKQDQLTDLIDHLGRLRAYYAAEAAALSRASLAQNWDGSSRRYTAELVRDRMELAHNAEELWSYLLGI